MVVFLTLVVEKFKVPGFNGVFHSKYTIYRAESMPIFMAVGSVFKKHKKSISYTHYIKNHSINR